MIKSVEIHPDVKASWRLIGFEGDEIIDRMSDTQTRFRRGIIDKKSTVQLIVADCGLMIDSVTEKRRAMLEWKLAQSLKATIVSLDSVDILKADSSNRRLASAVAFDDLVCAIYHQDTGIVIADAPVLTANSITPKIESVLDDLDFDIPEKLIGMDQLDVTMWVEPWKISEIMSATIYKCVQLFQRQFVADKPPTGTTVYLLGMYPWDWDGSNLTWGDIVGQAILNSGWTDAFTEQHVTLDLDNFTNAVGIVYGGKFDRQFSTPTIFNLNY